MKYSKASTFLDEDCDTRVNSADGSKKKSRKSDNEGNSSEKRNRKSDTRPNFPRKSFTRPNSPRRKDDRSFGSEPSTPAGWMQSLTKSDLREAATKLSENKKPNRKGQLKREKKAKAKEEKAKRLKESENRQQAWMNRVENGRSKKDAKRAKFYNSAMKQRKMDFAENMSAVKKIIKKSKESKKSKKVKHNRPDINLTSFFKMKF